MVMMSDCHVVDSSSFPCIYIMFPLKHNYEDDTHLGVFIANGCLHRFHQKCLMKAADGR